MTKFGDIPPSCTAGASYCRKDQLKVIMNVVNRGNRVERREISKRARVRDLKQMGLLLKRPSEI